MIAFNSNGAEVFGVITRDLTALKSPVENDKLLRKIASTLTASMSIRVHEQGKASDGTQIGTYSPEYMKIRTGQYGNAIKVSRGKNKGKLKDAGVYTKGKEKGNARKKYNRTSDTKVILSLTRQMENDLSVCEQSPIKTTYGYAIGYQNQLNMEKLENLELKYKKKILTKLSKEEESLIELIVDNAVRNSTNNQ